LCPVAGSFLEFYIDSNGEETQSQERTKGKEVVGFRIKTTMGQTGACRLQSRTGKVTTCPKIKKLNQIREVY
jgi:hypothetical protein